MLQRLVKGRESVTLVLGDQGSGKTTFIKAFMERSNEKWNRCKIKTIDTASGKVKSDSRDRRPRSAYLLTGSDVPVVMIDDAHFLNRAELTSLFRDAYNPRKKGRAKRLVLFGDPSINATVTELAELQDDSFIINRIHMPRLNREETAAYIQHRLSSAGYTGKLSLPSSAIRYILRQSGGIPGQIHQAVREKLQSGLHRKASLLPRISGLKNLRLLWLGVGLSGLALLVLAAVVFFPRPSITVRKPQKALQTKQQPKQAETARKVAARGPDGSGSARKVAARRPDESRSARKEAARRPDGSGSARKEAARRPDESGPTAARRSQSHPKPVAISAAQKNLPSPPLAAAGSSVPHIRSEEPTASVRKEAWLIKQPAGNYTIQLIGVRNEQSLLEFIQRHGLPKKQPVAYYQTSYKGGRWYPLLYGQYPTADQARQAIKTLPEPIQAMNPWIRSLSSIQNDIRSRGSRSTAP